MKFHLSHLLLLTVIVAVSLGWYVDHRNRSRREIYGNWAYRPGATRLGYASTIRIHEDGTFSKTEDFRMSTVEYEGRYKIEKNGEVVFRINKRTETSSLHEVLDMKPDVKEMEVVYRCRCAIDKAGFLIIDDQGYSSLRRDSYWPAHWEGSYKWP